MSLNAAVTRSLVAPPPTSRKFAGDAAVELDDVHRRHGEAGAVHHAADIAVELDVVELVLGGFELGRVFLGLVAHLFDLGMAEQRVVVEVHLGVEREHVAGAGDDQRIDLDDRGIEAGEGLVHAEHELGRGGDLLALRGRGRRPARARGSLPCRSTGSIATRMIFSGCLAATSSISMPPSVEAITVMREVRRSISMPR